MESYRDMVNRIRGESLAYQIQLAALGIFVAIFYIILARVAPVADRLLIVVGTVLFVAAFFLPHFTSATPHYMEPVAVCLTAFLAFVMPISGHPPIARSSLAAGIIGMLAVEGLYAVQRFPPHRAEASRTLDAVRGGMATGLFFAVCYSAFAAIILGIGALAGSRSNDELRTPSGILLLLGGYFVGGLVAGLLVGLLRHLLRWPLTTMVVGVIAGIAVYGAIAPVVILTSHGTLAEMVEAACGCGIIVGPPAALSLNNTHP